MKLEEAIINWLSVKKLLAVAPDDQAALETETLFQDILRKDFGVDSLMVKEHPPMIRVNAVALGKEYSFEYRIERIQYLLNQLLGTMVTTNHPPTDGGDTV